MAPMWSPAPWGPSVQPEDPLTFIDGYPSMTFIDGPSMNIIDGYPSMNMVPFLWAPFFGPLLLAPWGRLWDL